VTTADELEELVAYVRETRGFDFGSYKRSSLGRRVQKRIDALHLDSIAAYRVALEENPDEFAHLFNTVLINVTSFFRDPDTWTSVEREVIPRILKASGDHTPIRVWTPGCATGEEAYTVVMLLCEALGDDACRQRVKVYATDVDEEALNAARHARYRLKTVVDALTPERLERFFERDGTDVLFRKDLRRSVIFGRHDLLRDPPISRVDLLTCRNTLMYFTAAAQGGVLVKLHFALRPHGFLVVGRAETLASRVSMFSAFDVKRRIFVREPLDGENMGREPERREAPVIQHDRADYRAAGFDTAPAAQILVDTRGRIVGLNQHARMLFGLTSRDIDRPIQDLEISYRPMELRSRIEVAYAERRPVVESNVHWTGASAHRWFDIVVTPLVSASGALLGSSVAYVDVSAARRVQDELDRSRSELETAYEELQSTVEELETTNEELQSTNEELETMNEELQSTNEELETINDELRQRTEELNDLNDFLEAILTSLQSAVIVVNREMRVQVWNDQATDLWGLRAEEAEGDHLMNLDIGLPVDQLHQSIRACLNGEMPAAEASMPAINRRGRPVECRVRMTPLRRAGSEVAGIILLIDALETDGTVSG
jgi:two-component system CheB/CheR fusion protein